MQPFLIYLIQVNIALALFYCLYAIVLKRDTFFKLRRLFFLSAIVFSLLYPFFTIPALSDAWISRATDVQDGAVGMVIIGEPGMAAILDGAEVEIPRSISREKIFFLLYIMVTLFFVFRFLFQLFSIYRIRIKAEKHFISGIPVHELKEDITPFSFFNLIFIHTEKHTEAELSQILLHEQTHVLQRHSIDIMLIELVCLFSWWNPFVWLMKREMAMNLEYLADNNVLSEGVDCREYQYHLLRLTYHETAVQIVNNFNVSQLKQRIMMMNKTKSSTLQLVKYLLMLPLFFLFLMANSIHAAQYKDQSVAIQFNNEPPPEKKEGEEAINQDKKKDEVGDDVVIVPHSLLDMGNYPQFPGGIEAMMKFLRENTVYPKEAFENKIQGRVICTFVVMKDGSINSVEVLRGVDPLLDREAVRVIESMPRWEPGTQDGEPVNMQFTMPLVFRLENPKKEDESFEAVNVYMDAPKFPEGEEAFMKFIADNIRYPFIAVENGIQGVVSATFNVNSNGKISFVRFDKGVDPSLDAEVRRVIEAMPDWIPGKVNGEATSVTTGIHVFFRLQGEGVTPYSGQVPQNAVVVTAMGKADES